MPRNPERLAWAVLVTAFSVFCLLLVAIPTSAYYLLINAERRLSVTAELTGGTVLLSRNQSGLPEALISEARDLPQNTLIDTDNASQTVVTLSPPGNGDSDLLATLQLFANTRLTLRQHNTPQFAFSPHPNRIDLDMQRGRVRVELFESSVAPRPTTVTLQTPHALITLTQPGSYSVEVTADQTQVFVRTGEVTVAAAGDNLLLTANQRSTILTGQPPGDAETGVRNLILNGDFSRSLSVGWSIFKNRATPEATEGEIAVLEFQGRRAIHFARFDDNWAELGLRQDINRDIRDLQSLRLQLAVWLVEQSLYNCGSLGSECPVMARIEFTDSTGVRRELLQGFYYRLAPSNTSPGIPTRCVTCPPPTGDHLRIQRGVWFIFESPDLLQAIRSAGFQPVTLNTVTIYASGHRFESYVAEIALLAQD